MAVVCESAAGWLLDELALVNKWYQVGGGLGAPSQPQEHGLKSYYRLRDDFFRLHKPYFTVQPFPPPAETSARESDSATRRCARARQIRKRSNAYNQGELDALEYHKKVFEKLTRRTYESMVELEILRAADRFATMEIDLYKRVAAYISELILEGSRLLIQEGFKKGLLHSPSGTEEEKCKIMSEVYDNKRSLADLCDMTKDMPCVSFPEYTVNILDTGSSFSQDGDYLLHITENTSDCPQIIHLMGEKYLIPPRSSFLLSDISCMEPLLHYKKYSIIVIDPPWENKSVKRSKRYNSLSPLKIKELPIPALAAPDCLVITWVTNRQKHLRFVKEELYPHWSIRSLAEWHWVKITQSGEFVFPIDSLHKKPYEILVLGRLKSSDNSTERELKTVLPPIPDRKVIVSVPCSLHSHKPPLSEVLKEYVKPDVERLELFARNLQPGWTSWGNEVLKFQHMDYFIPPETGD